MKATALIGICILGLILGTTVPARAQHGHKGEKQAGPQKQHKNDHPREHGRASAQNSGRHEAGRPQQQHEQQAREQHGNGQQARGPEPSRWTSNQQPRLRPVRDVWQPHRAQQWRSEHHSWRERGGYHGERIPEDRFREHFGRGHCFRIHRNPVIVVNRAPRFQYGGYWFTLVDPWPEYWSGTWYRTDEVYIDYVNDGYYMYNRQHPGIAIAVNISL